MRGKEKCKALKEIRRQIAEENDIPYVVSQCTHQGDCRGTCPKCEAELRYLERELAIRQGLGKAVAVVGISATVCAGLTACSPAEMMRNTPGNSMEDLAGAATVAYPEDVAGYEETWPELNQTKEQMETHSTAPEERTESLKGIASEPSESLDSEETEELVMGEILPPVENVSELSGAVSENWENGAASQAPMEEGQ